MRAQEYVIRYRLEVEGLNGVRLALAKLLLAMISGLLKVRVKPTLDTHKATRHAEVEPHREFMYRGTPVGETVPDPKYLAGVRFAGAECGKCHRCFTAKVKEDGDPQTHCGTCEGKIFGPSPLKPSFDILAGGMVYHEAISRKMADATPVRVPHDPSPQGHVRCQVCDYPTVRLTDVAGTAMCSWCALAAPVAGKPVAWPVACEGCATLIDPENGYKLGGEPGKYCLDCCIHGRPGVEIPADLTRDQWDELLNGPHAEMNRKGL